MDRLLIKILNSGFKNVSLAIGTLLLFFAPVMIQAQTPDYSVWQQGATGLSISKNNERKTGGLGFLVKTVDTNNNPSWPHLFAHGGIDEAGWGNIKGPVYIDLGLIKLPNFSVTTPVEEVD